MYMLKSNYKLYPTWNAMGYRCNNPNSHNYSNYGGRGIKVCARWSGDDGFYNFMEDMGERGEGLSLYRIDNNSGYSPENCRWATFEQQCANRRPNKNFISTWSRMGYITKSLLPILLRL